METLRYNVVFKPEPEGDFTVTVPSLPGCVTYGRTLDEAKEKGRDAIKGYLISLKKHREGIPQPDQDSLIATIELKKSLIHV